MALSVVQQHLNTSGRFRNFREARFSCKRAWTEMHFESCALSGCVGGWEQLGVRWSVQRTTSELTRELAKDDFSHVPREVRFPRQGRKTPPETPPHASGDFKFKVSAQGLSMRATIVPAARKSSLLLVPVVAAASLHTCEWALLVMEESDPLVHLCNHEKSW